MSAGNAGIDRLALSLKVKSTFAAERPRSDMSLTPLLAGFATRMSRSCVEVWLRPKRLTVTRFIGPGTQLTLTTDGYGLAAARSLMVMGAGFVSTNGFWGAL